MDVSWLPPSEFQSLSDQIKHVRDKAVRVLGELNPRVMNLEQALDLEGVPPVQVDKMTSVALPIYHLAPSGSADIVPEEAQGEPSDWLVAAMSRIEFPGAFSYFVLPSHVTAAQDSVLAELTISDTPDRQELLSRAYDCSRKRILSIWRRSSSTILMRKRPPSGLRSR